MKAQTYSEPIKACIFCIFLLLLVASCKTLKKDDLMEFGSAPLLGMVYDYDNQPCQDTQIVIDNEEETISDINGRFIFNNLSRGEHYIVAKKKGYETLSFSFRFVNRSQVLYLKMISFHQLLREIENAIENSNWVDAESFIRRAEALKKNDPVQQYLKAIYFNETGNPEEAVQTLLAIIKNGHKEPIIYLTLSDIYQYRLNNIPEALKYLQEYLKLEEDREMQKRFEKMKEEIETETNE